MELRRQHQHGYEFVDEGEGPVLLLLHGLFGALSNWQDVVQEFASDHRVIIPLLPIYDMPLSQAGVPGLVAYVEGFVKALALPVSFTVLGNSLGGHIALVYTLNNPSRVKSLVRKPHPHVLICFMQKSARALFGRLQVQLHRW